MDQRWMLLQNPLDLRQVFHTNLQLLGFNPVAMERKWKIPFNKDMFHLPNKKGFELVIHFLFNRLNSGRCREEFRDCWPVNDKKQEQQFRKVCNNWLSEIAKEDPDAHLPRIVASLFMSPGGDKFYHVLFAFSRYVVFKVMENEQGMKEQERLNYPVLTPKLAGMANVISRSLQCGTARLRNRVMDHVHHTTYIQECWKTYASDLVKEYRALGKEIKELERQVKAEVEAAAQGGAARGSPLSSRRRSGFSEYELDVQTVKRAQRVQKVREQWKAVDYFWEERASDREVVESILHGTLEKYRIDAGDLNVRVPDLLLRECEREIQRRNVDNIYKGGKLNLLSLLNLWNLSLHLYIEKLHQVGMPGFEDAVPAVTTQVHTHNAHLTNCESLRSKLSGDIIPELKGTVKALKKKLDSQIIGALSPHSIRTTYSTPQFCYADATTKALGLSLLATTPPVNFSVEGAEIKDIPMSETLRRKPDSTTTPEGARQLLEIMSRKSRAGQPPSPLVQGSPVFAPRISSKGQPAAFNSIPISKIPQYDSLEEETKSGKVRSRMRSAPSSGRHTTTITQQSKVKETSSGTVMTQSPQQSGAARLSLTSQVSRSKPMTQQDQVFKAPRTGAVKSKKGRAKAVTPHVEKHQGVRASLMQTPEAFQLLADEIVDSVFAASPLRNVEGASPENNQQIGFGKDAFVHRDKIARTPVIQAPSQAGRWQDPELHDSYGPLSSTKLDHSSHSTVSQAGKDKLATKLFGGDSDEDSEFGMPTPLSHQSPARSTYSEQLIPEPSPVAGSHTSDRLVISSTETSDNEDNIETIENNYEDQQAEHRAEELVNLMLNQNMDNKGYGIGLMSPPSDDELFSRPVGRGLLELGVDNTPTAHGLNVSANNTSGAPTFDLYAELQMSKTPELPTRSRLGQSVLLPASHRSPIGYERSSPRLRLSPPKRESGVGEEKQPTSSATVHNLSDRIRDSLIGSPYGDLLTSISMPADLVGKDNDDDDNIENFTNMLPGVPLEASLLTRLAEQNMEDREESDLEEIAEQNARIIQLENGTFSEFIEVSPTKKKKVPTATLR